MLQLCESAALRKGNDFSGLCGWLIAQAELELSWLLIMDTYHHSTLPSLRAIASRDFILGIEKFPRLITKTVQ